MKKERRLLKLLVMVGLILLMLGCAAKKSEKAAMQVVQEKSELRVGISPNYPPIIFKEGKEIKGLEADMAVAISEHFDLPLVYVERPFDKLILALKEGEIDIIMSGMSITKRREAHVQFVEPYMDIGQMAIIRKVHKKRFKEPREAIYVNGLHVGYQHRTTGMTFAVNNLLLAELVRFDSVDEGLEALRKGEIKVFIHDAPTAWRIAEDPSRSDLMVLTSLLTKESLAWAIHQEDRAFLRALNALVADWKKSGKLQKIINKWVPISIN